MFTIYCISKTDKQTDELDKWIFFPFYNIANLCYRIFSRKRVNMN